MINKFLFTVLSLLFLQNLAYSTDSVAADSSKGFDKKSRKFSIKQELTKAAPEKQMNLVIINDVSEVFYFDTDTDPSNLIKKFLDPDTLNKKAATGLLLEALLEDQIVLCPKLLWANVQYIVRPIEFITNPTYKLNPKEASDKEIQTFKEKIKLYTDFKKGNIKTFKEINSILNSSLLDFYIMYDIACSKNYTCISLTNDFILFIPTHIKDNYNYIPSGFYKSFKSFDYKMNTKKWPYENNYKLKDDLGEHLILALNTWKNEFAKTLKKEDQPFFNVFLVGHGLSTSTAGILTVNKKTVTRENKKWNDKQYEGINWVEGSDFLKLLDFFNYNVRTKTLSIYSCYTGGKKNINAYSLKNKYSNFNLDHLNYTIINTGVTYDAVRGTVRFLENTFKDNASFKEIISQTHDNSSLKANEFNVYFLAINKTPPNYKEALESVHFIKNREYKKLSNYIVIKLPHTSWFTQAEYDKAVMSLHQINMSTRKDPITVPKEVETLLIEANYIPKPLIINNPSIIMLPANYHNQNYWIKECHINAPEEPTEWKDLPNQSLNDLGSSDDSYEQLLLKKQTFLKETEALTKLAKSLIWNKAENINVFFDVLIIEKNKYNHVLFSSKLDNKEDNDYSTIGWGEITTNTISLLNSKKDAIQFKIDKNYLDKSIEIRYETKLATDSYTKEITTFKASIIDSLPASLKQSFLDDLTSKLEAKLAQPAKGSPITNDDIQHMRFQSNLMEKIQNKSTSSRNKTLYMVEFVNRYPNRISELKDFINPEDIDFDVLISMAKKYGKDDVRVKAANGLMKYIISLTEPAKESPIAAPDIRDMKAQSNLKESIIERLPISPKQNFLDNLTSNLEAKLTKPEKDSPITDKTKKEILQKNEVESAIKALDLARAVTLKKSEKVNVDEKYKRRSHADMVARSLDLAYAVNNSF